MKMAFDGMRWLWIDGDGIRQMEMNDMDGWRWLWLAGDSYGWLEVALDCWRQLWMAGDG